MSEVKLREEVTKRREELGEQLMAEFRRQGVECKKDCAMGAYWIDLEGHRGFTLALERQMVKAARPAPYGFDYTGRLVVGFQGFAQAGGTDLVEPENGFDLPDVVSLLIREAKESTARVAAFEAKRAAAERQASVVKESFQAQFAEHGWEPEVEGVVYQRDGNWEPRFDVSFESLTASEVRSIIAGLSASRSTEPTNG